MDISRLQCCEINYYIARILGVYETDELSRDIDPALVGLVVHRIFSELYRSGAVDPLDGPALEETLVSLLDDNFREELFYTREEELLKLLLRDNLLKSLKHDMERFKEGYHVCPEYMEQKLEAEIGGGKYLLSGEIPQTIRITGIHSGYFKEFLRNHNSGIEQ